MKVVISCLTKQVAKHIHRSASRGVDFRVVLFINHGIGPTNPGQVGNLSYFLSARWTAAPMSAGLSATVMPAACSAATFSAAVPLPPLMIAPA
jgi:hypothetical protein